MTRPPGHYGRAGKELAERRPSAETRLVAPTSWQWFLPRHGIYTMLFGIAALLTALLAAATGPRGAAAIGVVAVGVVLFGLLDRRLPHVGWVRRAAKADPLAAAHFRDSRARVIAVEGMAVLTGAVAGLGLLGIEALIGR